MIHLFVVLMSLMAGFLIGAWYGIHRMEASLLKRINSLRR